MLELKAEQGGRWDASEMFQREGPSRGGGKRVKRETQLGRRRLSRSLCGPGCSRT